MNQNEEIKYTQKDLNGAKATGAFIGSTIAIAAFMTLFFVAIAPKLKGAERAAFNNF